MGYIFLLILTTTITLLSIKPVKGYNDEYLSLQSTIRIKGLSAIWIIIHHISQNINLGFISQIIGGIGSLFVALFLFISGYGLMFNFQNKNNYFQSYYKRILRVLIPYWLIDIIILIYFFISGYDFSVLNWIISLTTIQISPKIATYWFICAITVMYLSFYLSFNILNKKIRILNIHFFLMIISTLVYCVSCIFIFNVSGTYTGTIFSFIFGLLWYHKKKSIQKIIRERYISSIIISTILFLFLFAIAKVIDNYSLPYQKQFSFLANNLASISFIILFMVIIQKIELKGVVSQFLGKLSYEIYIVHITCLGILKNENIMLYVSDNVFLFIFLLSTIILIVPIYYVSNIINSRLRNASENV